MATADDYADWIVKNKAKKGTPEFDTVVKAYQEAKSEEAKPAPPEPSATDQAVSDLKHGAGLAVRSGINAVAGVPAMLTDAVTGVANQFLPEGKRFKVALPNLNEILTKYGLPQPRDATERVASDVVGAMTGVGASAKAGQYAAPAVKELLTSGLGTQVSASGLGSLFGGVTREAGGGPVAQLLASLGGASLPAVSQVALRGAFPNMTEAGRLDTKGRMLNEAAGKQRDDVLAGLDASKRFVRGESPTSAQSASEAGAPTFAAIEKEVVSKYRPDLKFARDAENEAARLGAVREVGKDKATLDAAVSDRSLKAALEYQNAYKNQIKADPSLAVIFQDPFIKKEIPDALQLMKGRSIKGNLTEFLQNVKIGLDKQLSKTADDSLSSAQKAATMEAKQNLMNWLTNKNQPFDVARQNFAKRSEPINQMLVGQYLENKLTSPLTGSERPAVFSQAMRDAPGTIKRAAGGPRFESLGDVLTPQQTGLLGGVKSSLEREALTNEQATLGAQKARSILGDTFSPTEPPPWLHRAITTARFALEKIGVATKNKTLNELAAQIQDPATAAKLMREATPDQWKAMQSVIEATSMPTAMGGLFSTVQRGE